MTLCILCLTCVTTYICITTYINIRTLNMRNLLTRGISYDHNEILFARLFYFFAFYRERLGAVYNLLLNTNNPQAEYVARVLKKWGQENDVPLVQTPPWTNHNVVEIFTVTKLVPVNAVKWQQHLIVFSYIVERFLMTFVRTFIIGWWSFLPPCDGKQADHLGTFCRTVKVTDTEPYYIRAVPATKASILC